MTSVPAGGRGSSGPTDSGPGSGGRAGDDATTGAASGSSASRERMLGRIRAAVSGDEIEVPREYRRSTSGDLVALFAERVADYRATVTMCIQAELTDTIAQALAARGVRRLAVPGGLEWEGTELELLREPSVADLDLCDGVVTGCAVAIAETGTIVLDAGPDQGPRRLSLVPDYHLCVVRHDQVVGTVPEAIARLDPARPLTFISGPSATSDIELDRVEGVHGPRTLVVVVVVPAQPSTAAARPATGSR